MSHPSTSATDSAFPPDGEITVPLPPSNRTAEPVLHDEDGGTSTLPLPPEVLPSRIQNSHRNPGTRKPPRNQEASEAPALESGSVDPRLVQETQQQIKVLVDEIVQLAKQDLSISEFYHGFATRCVSALSSIGGAVWLKERNQLNLTQQINLAQTGLPQDGPGAYQHDRLLKQVFQDGQPTLALPGTVNTTDDSGNPTQLLLILAPIMYEGQAVGLIEIFQRPVTGPVTQRGYLRFLFQMAEVAGQYHKNRRLRELDEKQNLWGRLDQFLKCIHESLDTQRTAYNLANEGRRLIDCDRVSVALADGARLKIVATSGLDRVQRRADQVRHLEQLTNAVCRAKQPLYYVGPTDSLPPQIENALESYLDLSHSKAIAIVPIVHGPKPVDDQADLTKVRQAANVKKKLLGALIIEQLTDQRIAEEKSQRIELVTEHGASALANALDHNGIFLMPLWKALGKLSWFTAPANLPKTALATVVLIVGLAVLFLFPYNFTMSAKGSLQPVQRHEIYAQVDGLVTKIPLPNYQNVTVQVGQRLLEMQNRDMESEYTSLIGRMQEISELYREKDRSEKLVADRLEKLKMQGEILQIRSDFHTMEHQAKILQDKLQLLEINAPMAGQLINWNLRQTLLGRPLLAGERLMTVVNLQGTWELELYLPERGSSHVLKQVRDSEEPIRVDFHLASEPGKTYSGTISHVDWRAEVHEIHGNSLRVLVSLDDQQIPEALRRPGTGISAKIQCGKRPLGYVMFREVWETVQAQVLFWL